MEARLIKRRVKKGKEEALKKWIEFMKANQHEELLALQRGKIFLETYHLNKEGEHLYFFHYMIAESISEAVERFIARQDKVAQKQWLFAQECIDPDFEPIILQEQLLLINELFF